MKNELTFEDLTGQNNKGEMVLVFLLCHFDGKNQVVLPLTGRLLSIDRRPSMDTKWQQERRALLNTLLTPMSEGIRGAFLILEGPSNLF